MNAAVMLGFAAVTTLSLYLIKIRLDWINDSIRARDTDFIPLTGKTDEAHRILEMQEEQLRSLGGQVDLLERKIDFLETQIRNLSDQLFLQLDSIDSRLKENK